MSRRYKKTYFDISVNYEKKFMMCYIISML